jgi:8-oxo-dGTP pyrophosphatase MutT (NUDIX family)
VLASPRGCYRPLVVDGEPVGWLDDRRARRLAGFTDVFTVDDRQLSFLPALATPAQRTLELERVARTLAREGLLTAWRNERYAVAARPGGAPRFEIERAAARYLGVHTFAAHVNGLVHAAEGTRMWLARRSPRKAIDPGLLDNLVGGGIAAGSSVQATLVKEAWEEAGVAAAIAGTACSLGAVHVCRAQPDGLQRETIFVHDLWLAADFVPACQDAEALDHRRVALVEAAKLAANGDGPDVVTADASLVIVDCLIRHGLIAADSPDFAALSALRYPALKLAASS